MRIRRLFNRCRRRYMVLIHHRRGIQTAYFWTAAGAMDFMRAHLTAVVYQYGVNVSDTNSGLWYRVYIRCLNHSTTFHFVEEWGGYNYINDVIGGMPSGMEKRR